MATKELSEPEQRKVLENGGWIPLSDPPLGEGGGARVFKVVSMATINRLHASLMGIRYSSDTEEVRKVAVGLMPFLSDLVDRRELGVAAGKVAKNPDHRLDREIKILRDVRHPNLIKMHAYDKSAAPSWYVMPVMRGGTLKEERGLVGNFVAVVRGTLQLARALAALHTHRSPETKAPDPITHRDIKPGNVFIGDNAEWVLGDPGVAYRNDDGDETETRPLSKDWAPRWYDDAFARSSKADLYLLGATSISVLVGGQKPLDPSFLTKPPFDLATRFPGTPCVKELQALYRSLIVSDPADLPFDDASQLVPQLEALLPLVEDATAWRLRREADELQHQPRLVFSYTKADQSFVSGDLPGLQKIRVWIPADCQRLVFWGRGHQGHGCNALLFDDKHQVKAHISMSDDTPSLMDVPVELRGGYARITFAERNGLMCSILVHAERG